MALCDNPQPGNVQFDYGQLEYLWIQAGGQPQVAAIAAAIAMEESRGNSGATDCDSNGTIDRGLWQINSVHGAQSTYDVMGNARAAVSISNRGSDWSAWSSYASGAYKQFLQVGVAPSSAPINATQAAANNTTSQAQLTGTANVGPIVLPTGLSALNPSDWWNDLVVGTATNATETVGKTLIGVAIQGFITVILDPLLAIFGGVLGIAAGGTMVLFGIIVMVRNTETEQRMEQGIGKAAQTAVGLMAPETKAATLYKGASGQTTRVTSTRRPARKMNIGGRSVRFGQATVQTDVQRTAAPERMSVDEALRETAKGYQKTQRPGWKPGQPVPEGHIRTGKGGTRLKFVGDKQK